MSSIDEVSIISSNEQNPLKEYEVLNEDYTNYDLSFKVIIIGNSGN